MQEADLFGIFLKRLNESGVCYMVTGSVASIVYGEPRLTHDIDIVIELSISQITCFIGSFSDEEFYHPPVEVIQAEIMREARGHFNLIHHETGFKADIYPVGDEELHKWAMQNRNCIILQDTKMWIAPPEYVILRKLEYFQEGRSSKHLRDIEAVLRTSNEMIDRDLLRSKAQDLGVLKELEKLHHTDGF